MNDNIKSSDTSYLLAIISLLVIVIVGLGIYSYRIHKELLSTRQVVINEQNNNNSELNNCLQNANSGYVGYMGEGISGQQLQIQQEQAQISECKAEYGQ